MGGPSAFFQPEHGWIQSKPKTQGPGLCMPAVSTVCRKAGACSETDRSSKQDRNRHKDLWKRVPAACQSAKTSSPREGCMGVCGLSFDGWAHLPALQFGHRDPRLGLTDSRFVHDFGSGRSNREKWLWSSWVGGSLGRKGSAGS